MSGVIDTASFLAKENLDQCIQHLESDCTVDREWLVEALYRSWDRVQMAAMANALTEMVGFGMVDTASRAVYAPASADGEGNIGPD